MSRRRGVIRVRAGRLSAALVVLTASFVAVPPLRAIQAAAAASATATMSTGGGPSSGVVADAGPDQTVSEGSTVTLHGSGSDTGAGGDSGSVSYKWQLESADGPPVQLSSITSPTPSFSVFDDGTYTFRLTASSGGASASDDVKVRVVNAPPVIGGVMADPTTGDGLAEVTVKLSDPGPFDTHTIDVDWGDGTTSTGVPVSVDGSGWAYGVAGHVYAASGTATITAVAHDNDGGVSAPVSTTIDVGGADAGGSVPGASVWAADGTDANALWVTGSNNTFTSLVHSNGGIKVSGSSHTFSGGTEYGSSLNVTGSGTTIVPAATQVAPSGFPYPFAAADYAPGGTAAAAAGSAFYDETSACPAHGNASWQPSKPLVSGLYWVPCGVKISGSDVAGQVTIVASGDIQVSGSAAELTPFTGGLVFASTATDDTAIQLSGSDQVVHGSVVAPGGGVKVSGSRNTLQCGVFASTVRISGSNDAFGGANCSGGSTGGSAVSIAAPPVLVPDLSVGLKADGADVSPGSNANFTATVANGTMAAGAGASLFVPVEMAVSASSATPVSVDGATFTLEAHDPATDAWSPVASSDPSTGAATASLSATPNAAAGVTYPTGGDGVAGTAIGAGAFASWAGVAKVALDTAQVQALLDPARVDALRERVSFATSGGSVQTLSRFSVDPLGELRAAPAADVSDVAVHWAAGGIDPVTTDSSTVASLGVLHPGDAVPVSLPVAVPAVAPKGDDESDGAYLARLGEMDGSKVVATAYGTGTASPGTLYAPMQQASATVGLPVVTAQLTGPASVQPGDSVPWSVKLTNTGLHAAADIAATLTVDGTEVALSGVPDSLAAGASATLSASSSAPSGNSGTVHATVSVSWSDASGSGGAYGPVSDATTVSVVSGTASGPLELSPAVQVREVGGHAKVTAELVDSSGGPVAGVPVAFQVAGQGSFTRTVTTGVDGSAVLDWVGTGAGSDTVTASATVAGVVDAAAGVSVTWRAKAPEGATVANVQGRFFHADPASTAFAATPADQPVFEQSFPDVAFNPPAGLLSGDPGSDPNTAPFTDVSLDSAGEPAGTIVAQGNGHVAGSGDLTSFDAVLTGQLSISEPGDWVLRVDANDGFVLGVDGLTAVSGPEDGAPSATPFEGLTVVAAHDSADGGGTYEVVVHAANPGTYDFELDYLDRSGTPMSLVLSAPQLSPSAVTVPSTADIFGAGHGTAPEPGGSYGPGHATPPVDSGLSVEPGSTVSLPSVIGSTTSYLPVPPCGGPVAPADGVVYTQPPPNITSYGGISGIVSDRQQSLVGVFVSDVEPADPAPSRLTFTSATPTPAGEYSFDFTDLSPELNQVFFIGDGHTDAGVVQKFHVPAGATHLYLGMADASSYHGAPGHYGDNCGELRLDPGDGTTQVVPPAGALATTVSPTTASVGADATIAVTATDADGQLAQGLPVMVVVGGANNLVLSATTGADGVAHLDYSGLHAGSDYVQAIATSGGNRLYSNAPTITWTQPGQGAGGSGGSGTDGGGGGLPGPVVSGCSPADGATVTDPGTIACTLIPASGTSVASWQVSARPVGGAAAETRVLGSGSGTAVSVPLDPTVLADGQWTITVTATGSDGGATSSSEVVIIDGRFKPGRIRVSYDDLDVPVSGIPIRLTRTYDSLDRLRQGDFGQGWSLGLANFRVQAGRGIGKGGWSQTQCGSVLVAAVTCLSSSTDHVVTVTWPDGHTESFRFTPKPSPPGFTFMNQAAYTPIGDAASTLSPAPGDDFVTFAGTSDLYVPLSGDVYDPQRFVLTGKDGTQYLIDAATGLVSATTVDGKTVTVSRDGVTSSEGPSVSFTRDSQGRIIGVTGPAGETRGYRYDGEGDLVAYTNGRGQTQAFSYQPGHYLAAVPGGGVQPAQTFSFDADGRVSSITDAQGHTTAVSFDLGARTQTVTSPGGVVTVTEDNALGDPVRETKVGGGLSAVTTWTRDDEGRILTETDPDGGVTSNTYDAKGNLTALTDPDGVTTATSYNSLAEPVDTTVGGVVTEHRSYDAQGRLLTDGRPGQSPTSYTWAGGHVSQVTDPTGTITSLAYNAAGYLDQVATPSGTTQRITDESGHVIGIVSPAGVHTGYEYDADGNLTALVGADNVSQTWTYDPAGHVTAAVDKNNDTTTYAYDNSGQLVSVKDRNNQTTSYTYTPDAQVASITTPQGATTVNYDGLGRPESLSNPTATVSLGWSLGGQLTSESTHYTGTTVPDQTVNYTTTSAGNITSITGQGSTTNYTWDAQGRLAGVDDTVAGDFGFEYDDATGNLSSMTRPNSITDQFTFDADGRLTARDAVNGSGTTLDEANYTYNDAGLRDTLTDLQGTHDYTYDTDGHLTGVDNPDGGATDEAYTYDALGNLTSWPGNPAAQVTHNQADQLTQDATNTYSYDNEGNQTQAKNRSTGATTKYTWNAAHQLTKITNPDGTSVTYGYGPLGRRLTATDSVTGKTVFVWAGANLRATLDATGALVNRNITTPDLNGTLAVTTPGGTSYPLKDGLGSTTATTNATGNVTSTTSYTAYGTPTTTGNNDGVDAVAGYTGHQTDPTSLIYARARYYNPNTATFQSQDRLPGVNSYDYVKGEPTTLTDPSGEISSPGRFALASCLAVGLNVGAYFIAPSQELANQARENVAECFADLKDAADQQAAARDAMTVAEEMEADAETIGTEVAPNSYEQLSLFEEIYEIGISEEETEDLF